MKKIKSFFDAVYTINLKAFKYAIRHTDFNDPNIVLAALVVFTLVIGVSRLAA